MGDDVERLVEAFTSQDMTAEGRACVLGYARGRLDFQREFKGQLMGVSPEQAQSQAEAVNAEELAAVAV